MKQKLLMRLSSVQFCMLEMRQFLDTHPNDPEALEMYNKYIDRFNALKKEYEEQCGPLTLSGNNSDDWLKNPWPWDPDFENACDCDSDK